MKTPKLLAAAFVLLWSGAADRETALIAAQDRSGLPDGPSIQAETLFAGVPSYSVMKTENGLLNLGNTAVDAFAPLAGLPCPASAGPSGCTIRVTVSSQFSNIGASNARMELAITGPGTLGPAGLVAVVTNQPLLSTSVHSMQWLKRNVPAGSTVTVTMKFNVTGPSGSAGFRTMSVDVFSGLL